MGKKTPVASVPVEAHKHVADKRLNILTRETAAFAAEDGQEKFVVRHTPSIRSWSGKARTTSPQKTKWEEQPPPRVRRRAVL